MHLRIVTPLGLGTQQVSKEEGPELAVPPPVSRRTLELLVYLARHQPRLAREITFQLVPLPAAPKPAIEVHSQFEFFFELHLGSTHGTSSILKHVNELLPVCLALLWISQHSLE